MRSLPCCNLMLLGSTLLSCATEPPLDSAGASTEVATSALSASAGGGWEPPWRLDMAVTDTRHHPKIAADAHGNAIVVWSDYAPAGVQATRYLAGQGWGAPELVGRAQSTAEVALDASGAGFVVWSSLDCPAGRCTASIWGRGFTIAGGFGAPGQLATFATEVGARPNLAMSVGGDGLLVWDEQARLGFPAGPSTVRQRRYLRGQGWLPAESLWRAASRRVHSARAALAAGGSLAVWDAATEIWASPYDAVTGEEWQEIVAAEPPVNSLSEVAIDARGHALVTWVNYAGLFARRLGGRLGSSEVVRLSGEGSRVIAPSCLAVAAESRGGAVAAWYEAPWPGSVWANRFDPKRGWGGPERLHEGRGSGCPAVAIDAAGSAHALFGSPDSGVRAVRAALKGSWIGPALVHDTDRWTHDLRLAADSRGDVFAVWVEYVGEGALSTKVWSSRFVAAR